MSAHTPGPWSLDAYRPGDKELFVSEAGVTVDIDDCTTKERAERFANARLIAAAPDLLDACRTMGAMILGIAEAIDLDTETEMKISVGGQLAKTITLGEAVQQVTTAIAKATGKEPA
jgi:hypothetical protein